MLVLLAISLVGCELGNEKATPPIEYSEVRITGSVPLYGAETLIIRKLGNTWSATFFGDFERFRCFYRRPAEPKTDWDSVWKKLIEAGVLSIPDGSHRNANVDDGRGYEVEVFHEETHTRYAFYAPEHLNMDDARKMLNIGKVIGEEFDSPMFWADYRIHVGDYFLPLCGK